jgi:SAM-dependent methyltransferase
VPDASVDVAYSFKVLAHIPPIAEALAEMARVVRPGGWVLAEFYNTRSIRRLVKAMKPATAVSDTTNDEAVYTRYDSADDIRGYLPPTLKWVTSRGIRIVTPVAQIHQVPGLGALIRAAEHRLADLPIARDLGGFLVVCAQRI